MISAIGIDCISGKSVRFKAKSGKVRWETVSSSARQMNTYIGPGLIDIQVNGIGGIDFNTNSLTVNDVYEATKKILREGITLFFPTVITNEIDSVISILKTIHRACREYPLVNDCIGGIHLEGPFISTKDGSRGAHDSRYIQDPDIKLFEKFQEAAGGKIRIITLAPELTGSMELIRYCHKQGIVVGIGHSEATTDQIDEAVKAGARISTHLGNAVPLMLPRHPNLLWDQLAQNKLYASIIADGFHLSESFIKVVARVKRNKTILISDMTEFAGMPPGRYRTHIGSEVILTEGGKVYLKDEPRLKAGAAKTLLDNIGYLLDNKIVNLRNTWQMASINPASLLRAVAGLSHTWPGNDVVIFRMQESKVCIHRVIKNGSRVV
jgi:N-acetylglucosamine-6-phosphate deacetylase